MAIVKALLAAGADVTLKDLKGGAAIEICLLSAGRKSNVQIIKALLEGCWITFPLHVFVFVTISKVVWYSNQCILENDLEFIIVSTMTFCKG